MRARYHHSSSYVCAKNLVELFNLRCGCCCLLQDSCCVLLIEQLVAKGLNLQLQSFSNGFQGEFTQGHMVMSGVNTWAIGTEWVQQHLLILSSSGLWDSNFNFVFMAGFL